MPREAGELLSYRRERVQREGLLEIGTTGFPLEARKWALRRGIAARKSTHFDRAYQTGTIGFTASDQHGGPQ
jgi:hypothetical protein